ncbi:MAG: SPOR domain-containing protein [Deinococcota bacterium]
MTYARYTSQPTLILLTRIWFTCLTVLLTALITTATAQTVTVQVAALSDEAAAINLQRDLVNQDFPAYLESVETETGFLYRLRVGAFGDRDAAVLYAAELAKRIPGSEPIPATAGQLLPPGIAPLLPRVVARYPYEPLTSELRVVRWGDGYALRFQDSADGQPLEAEYRVLVPGLDTLPFLAWRAAPDISQMPDAQPISETVTSEDMTPEDTSSESDETETTSTEAESTEADSSSMDADASTPSDGTVTTSPEVSSQPAPMVDSNDAWSLRVSSIPLAPATSSGLGRDDAVAASLAQVARTMELDVATVSEFVRYPVDGSVNGGVPFLVIVERYNILTGATQSYDALGDVPDGMNAPAGPSLTWYARAVPENLPMSIGETVLEPRAILGLNRSLTLLPAADELMLTGDAWQASAEDGFTRIDLNSGTSWRAVVGFPLWATGEYVLAFANDELVVYHLQ